MKWNVYLLFRGKIDYWNLTQGYEITNGDRIFEQEITHISHNAKLETSSWKKKIITEHITELTTTRDCNKCISRLKCN